MKKYFLLFLLLLPAGWLIAQQTTITGQVTDAADGSPLPGVTITVKGGTEGASTDEEGNFQIGVPGADAVLIFTFLGYQQQEIPVGAQTSLNVQLNADVETLEDVVVVGYGTQKEVNVTGSVQTVKGEEIARQPVQRASAALTGRVPGLTATQNSGQPGADDADLVVRGVGTMDQGKAGPLVLVDGIEGSIDGVNPRDIENVSILKDASAAAIYGSRAANGVILVTTKRGAQGAFKVNYNAYGGWQQPTNLPDYVGGYDYMVNYNLARENMGQDPLYSQNYLNEYQASKGADPDHYPDTDWIDEVFSENGFQQSHYLSLTGGNEMVRVLGSFGYMDQSGNIKGYNSKRYETRINTDITLSEKVGFNLDFSARKSIQDQPSGTLANIIRDTYRIPPIFAARYSDGSWGPGWSGGNPVARVNDGGFNQDEWNTVRGVLRAYYQPVSELKLSVMYSPEYSDTYGKQFNRQYQVFNFDTKELQYTVPSINSLVQNNNRTFTNNLNALAEYEKTSGDHYFKGMAGYELITSRIDWFEASRDNFPIQDYPQLGVGSQENMQNDGSASEWGLQSFFARVNYSYKERYLFEANVRHDGSSRFSEGNKYGTFPSFSAGWRISEEPFFASVGFIDDLKLRGSWGRMGNQRLRISNQEVYYPFASTVALGNDFPFGGVPAAGAAQTELANKEISWETTETTNFGIDVAMLSNRLTFTAEYYVRNTYDILLQLPIPMSIGLNAPFQNAGKVRNEGWDLALGWQDNAGEFSYGVDFNISDVHNSVVDLVGTGPYISGYTISREGDPINSIYGYKSNGFFQNEAEIAGAPAQIGALAPGDIKYVNQLTIDTDGDGVADAADELINSEDRVIIGDPFPRYSYGLNLFAGFKGIDLSLFFQGVGKRDAFLRGDAVWAFQNGGKIQQWHLDYWTPENPDAAYPRLVATTSHNNFETSDFWVWSAAYLRLRNLTVGYTFPGKIMDNIFVDKLRLYFTGQNLFTIDDMPPGMDPDVPNGTPGDMYPIAATFTFGIDLTF